MSETIKSVEEFIEWTKQLDGQMLLYRGLANAGWEVESSAYRRIKVSQDDEPLPATFQNYIKQLLDQASLQGFRYQHGRKLSDLDLLAELQHYGAATCLIDFTENALTALWFACREKPEKDGIVVAMATDDTETFSTVSYEDLNRPIEEFLNPGKLWKWTPSSLNNRIVSQQSVFVFGEDVIYYNSICGYDKIRIDAGSKKDILATLEKSFGAKEQNLFNDLAGFALCNAHDKQYDDYTAEDYFRLGLRFQQQRKHKKAKDYYDKALNRNPRYAEAYNNRGYSKFVLGNPQDAILDYNEAIKLNPRFAEVYNNRGVAKRALGNPQDAILDYNEAIKFDPRYAEAYNNRGNARVALGKYQDAISDYNKAIKLNPRFAEAYNNRGVAKRALKEYQDAILDYNEAIKLDPQYAEAYNNRGVAKNDSGDHQGAISDYNKAIKLNPQYAKAYRNRGDAKNASGDREGAKEDWERAREIDPNLQTPGS